LEWLEGFVQEYPKAALIISHDRAFLNATVTRTLFLDPETHQVTSYPGSYDDFVEARAEEARLHAEAWARQQEYVSKVESDINRLKSGALTIERGTTSRQPGIRVYAKKKAKLALSREKKLERYIESSERVEKPRPEWGLHVDLGEPSPAGRDVVRLADLSFGFPGQPDLFSSLDLNVRAGERIAIAGPNGAGKSTLLHLISGKLRPRGGTVTLGSGIVPGLVSQEHEALDLERTVLDSARLVKPLSETDTRTFLHYFLFAGDDVLRKVGECSLGERSRLQLALVVLAGCNLLLLDEPLNHLDVDGREHLQAALERYRGTVIAVSHDRAFLRTFPTRIVGVRGGEAMVFEAGYEEYTRWK
jgi:ATP-binding cassette subfamily F protein 3